MKSAVSKPTLEICFIISDVRRALVAASMILAAGRDARPGHYPDRIELLPKCHRVLQGQSHHKIQRNGFAAHASAIPGLTSPRLADLCGRVSEQELVPVENSYLLEDESFDSKSQRVGQLLEASRCHPARSSQRSSETVDPIFP